MKSGLKKWSVPLVRYGYYESSGSGRVPEGTQVNEPFG